jgi:hypothetical protein
MSFGYEMTTRGLFQRFTGAFEASRVCRATLLWRYFAALRMTALAIGILSAAKYLTLIGNHYRLKA